MNTLVLRTVKIISQFFLRLCIYFHFTPLYILHFIRLQLFLTLIAWPILLFWGLPLSLASPLGNLLFAPFLTIFLLFSSIIFFCELVYIPNTWLIIVLDYLSSMWSWIISWAHRSWFLRCAQPSLIIALCIPLGALVILHYKKLSAVTYSTCVLGVYTFATIACLSTFVCPDGSMPIACFHKELTLIHAQSFSALIDTGALGHKASVPQWVTYTLIPELTRKGIKELAVIIALKPSNTTFKALARLVALIPIKKLYIASWQGSLSYRGWKSWEELLSTLRTYRVSFECIDQQCLLFTLDTGIVSLIPEKQKVRKNKLAYPLIKISGFVKEYTVTLHNK